MDPKTKKILIAVGIAVGVAVFLFACLIMSGIISAVAIPSMMATRYAAV